MTACVASIVTRKAWHETHDAIWLSTLLLCSGDVSPSAYNEIIRRRDEQLSGANFESSFANLAPLRLLFRLVPPSILLENLRATLTVYVTSLIIRHRTLDIVSTIYVGYITNVL